MKHLNGNLLCAIDTETTGTDFKVHDIIQIAIIPLSPDLKVSSKYTPFDCRIKPARPENIDQEALRVNRQKFAEVMVNGLESDVVADILIAWFENLKLGEGKRIMPLAHNWFFDGCFIREWLGPATFNYIFDGRYRDTMSVSLYLNDVADHHNQNCPFPKHGLRYVASQVGLIKDQFELHDAVVDTITTAETYKRMLSIKGTLGEL